METKACVNISVSGKVQGVFFRVWTKRLAEKLELSGWVKNSDIGNVEILAEGNKDMIDKLIKEIENGGSKLARVENIEVKWEDFTGQSTNFEIRI